MVNPTQPEVMPEQLPENQVKVFDTTLRDGEQSPGIALSVDDKLEIGQQLEKAGVDVIEAGFPITSPGDFEAVQTLARNLGAPVVAGLARTRKVDIEKAGEAVKDANNPRIHTFISTSDVHIRHQLQTDREDVKGQAKAAVSHAKSLVDDVEFSPMDATRADWAFTAEVVQIAVDEGATVINIPDTVGYTTPDEYKKYIEFLRREVKGADRVTWSVHCHNDLGLAVANSYAGIQAGARQVEGAFNGIGERAGNAALEEIVMLIKTREDVSGVYTGIISEEIGNTSRMVSRKTGYPVQPNKAIVGRNAFSHESGIHQDGVLKERSTYEIMSAEEVGNDAQQIVLGKHSGRHAVRDVIDSAGTLNERVFKSTFDLFKGFAEKVGGVSEEQIVEIQDEAARREAARFDFVDHKAESRGDTDSATVTMIDKTTGIKFEMAAMSDDTHKHIDGPVAAVISAVQKGTETNYDVLRVNHESVGKGSSAIDRAFVEIKINGESIIGQGLSTNTLKASGLAYIDAIRRAAERKN